jgi:hypothetical protein
MWPSCRFGVFVDGLAQPSPRIRFRPDSGPVASTRLPPTAAHCGVRLRRLVLVLQLVDHGERALRVAWSNLPGKGVDHPACDGLTGLRHGYPVERVVLLFAVFNLPQYFDILRSSGDLAA